jgi:hypothetical protein
MPEIPMSPQQLEKETAAINAMTREEMCRKWRFAPCGDPYFHRDHPLCAIFKKRFDELGGFSPGISKQLGWAK